MIITLKYGCPNCPPEKVPTGHFDEYQVWVDEPETMIQRLSRRFRRTPRPRHRETKRVPHTLEVFKEKNIQLTFKSVGEKNPHFKCAACGTRFKLLQLVSKDGATQWELSHHYKPGRSSITKHEIEDCKDCGGKLCRYSFRSKTTRKQTCRACGAGTFDSDLTNQHGVTWGPRK